MMIDFSSLREIRNLGIKINNFGFDGGIFWSKLRKISHEIDS